MPWKFKHNKTDQQQNFWLQVEGTVVSGKKKYVAWNNQTAENITAEEDF